VSIFENSEAGTFAVDVNATDQDTGDFGEVRYRLVDNPNNAFEINETTVRYTAVTMTTESCEKRCSNIVSYEFLWLRTTCDYV